MEYDNSKLLYVKIADDIQCQIVNGELLANDKLPTEKYYEDKYEVSRITVRKAMDELIARGLVDRRKNKGCYVRSSQLKDNHSLESSIYSRLDQKGVKVTGEIKKMEVLEADALLVKRLECEPGDKILLIERLRLVNDKPIAIQKLWLQDKLFPNFNPWKLCNDSLRRIMNEEYGANLAYSKENIEARMPTKKVAQLLQIPESTPLIFLTSKVYTANHDVAEYSETYYDTEEYAYTIRQEG